MTAVAAIPSGEPRSSTSILPGFGLAMGVTLTYLCLIVLIPLAGLFIKSASLGWEQIWTIARDDRTLAALKLSFGAALIAAAVNAVFGLVLAWILTRYRFPGRKVFDAMVDLPFALPTAVAGIALTSIYAPDGIIGQVFAKVGIQIAFTPAGVVAALIFIGLPFVVRTVQPVLEEIDRSVEEAAATLGASRAKTIFKVILPGLAPAISTGVALALARGIGEYGSVIFIAGNIPYVSEIAPLLIVIRLNEYDYAGATVIAAIMLLISFAMLFVINLIQAWSRRRAHG
jgi:sulfate transport system permease protein